MRPFEAIIFDHDGTLVDTELPDFKAWEMLFQEHNAIITLEEWAATAVGHTNGHAPLYDNLIAQRGNHLSEAAMYRRLRELWAITLEETTLMPGVLELLAQLQGEGYPLAVATAADRAWVTRWLTHFELWPFFQVVANADDVTHNKPAPDVYLLAAEQLGVDPTRCLVFEDSVAGLTAAKAAGMTVVALPNYVTKSLDFSAADVIVRGGLPDISPTWIAALGR